MELKSDRILVGAGYGSYVQLMKESESGLRLKKKKQQLGEPEFEGLSLVESKSQFENRSVKQKCTIYEGVGK